MTGQDQRITHLGMSSLGISWEALVRLRMAQKAWSFGLMDDEISTDLDAAFSLLPPEKARQAKEQVLQAHAAGGFALQLKWTEHHPDGTFLRGGITDMVSRTTELAAHSQDDPDLQELATIARRRSPLDGHMTMFPSNDRFAWFLPFSPSKADTVTERRVRGLLVTPPIFNQVIDLIQPDQSFTDSERRLLFQITAGMSLREAADHDGVSFETKRAHTKAVCSKMQCSGQKEAVRTVLGQMVHLLSITESEAAHGNLVEDFIARYLPDDARLMLKRLPNGRILRALISGPESGRPLVMIHGMMFPITLVGISRYLETENIRLIIPLRAGFLESRSSAELARKSDFISESFADIALFIERELAAPVAVLGQSLGAVLSIRFANRYPHLVSQLILQSINFTKGREEGGAGEFYGGLKRLSREPEFFKLANWQFHKYYADRSTGRAILSRLFNNSPEDMNVLDGEVTGTEAYQMFADLYAASVFGMSADFDFVMNSWESEAAKLNKPIMFIHGQDDPLTNPMEFARFAEKEEKYQQLILPGGGHFVAASHGSEVWQSVAGLV